MKGTEYFVMLAGVNSAGLGSFTLEMAERTAVDSEWSSVAFRTVLACV